MQRCLLVPLCDDCNLCAPRDVLCVQHQLNSLYEGATFEIATRYPISLNTVFVSMTYWYRHATTCNDHNISKPHAICTQHMRSSGLPILLPLATVSFAITYWVDKITCTVAHLVTAWLPLLVSPPCHHPSPHSAAPVLHPAPIQRGAGRTCRQHAALGLPHACGRCHLDVRQQRRPQVGTLVLR